MGIVLYLCLLVAMTIAFFWWLVPKSDRRFMLFLMLATLPVQIASLILADHYARFIEFEQDAFNYFEASQRSFDSWWAYFDLAGSSVDAVRDRVGGLYLHLLTITYQFVGANTLLYKALNLVSLWPTIFCWFLIAKWVGGVRFGRLCAVVTAWTTTFWYYYLILYRDLITTFLHSVLLLLAIHMFQRFRWRTVCGAAVIMTILYLFRPATVVLDTLTFGLVTLCTALLGRERAAGALKKAWSLCILGALGLGLYFSDLAYVATDRSAKETVDIAVLETDKYGGFVDRGAPTENRALRLLYVTPGFFMSDPAIISPKFEWDLIFDPEYLRSVMNVPWLLFCSPFAGLGLAVLGFDVVLEVARRRTSRRSRAPVADAPRENQRSNEKLVNPVVAAIVVGYVFLWWVVLAVIWDFWRWRLPVLPALVICACWALTRADRITRALVLGGWLGVLAWWRFR